MARRSDIDWPGVELDFRVGEMPVRQIAKKHGIADSNLRARARKEGWCRSDGEAARVAARLALGEANQTRAQEIGARIGAQQAQAYQEAMEETSLSAAQVTHEHQRAVRRGMQLAMNILGELETACSSTDVVDAEVARCHADDPSRAAFIERHLGVKARVETFDRWATALSKLVATEREAHDLASAGKPGEIDELLRRVHAERTARASRSQGTAAK